MDGENADGLPTCPVCNSTRTQKDGTRTTTTGKRQRYLCQDCNARFVAEPIGRIKGNLDAIITVMDLYMKGVSYRGIQDSLRQLLGLRATHVTVMRWVHAYLARINKYVSQFHPRAGKVWHADEQLVKVKGRLKYVWNCMDADTRFILASQVTPLRTYRDARTLFQRAKQTAHGTAETVITDGAFAYGRAVRKEFATYWNPRPHKRYVSIRQRTGTNNVLERYHGTFRQRDKVMRSFKTAEGTRKFTEGWRTYYNFIRPHETLNTTPAKAGCIQAPNDWKKLLLASLTIRRRTAIQPA
jgi:transposase-like protein